MIKNSGELIVLAQPFVFIHDLIHLLVKFGGGKYVPAIQVVVKVA